MLIADLHIHSRYSRATSKEITVEGLYRGAQLKGVGLIGSGDITHPAWFAELQEKLQLDKNGGYVLRPDLARQVEPSGPCQASVNFMLTGEISCIYKKNDQTRKIHCLVILPNLEAAQRLNQTLDKIGNIRSDGRPILGLDARDLLEICLTNHPDTIFIPAHIWTPWFSLFGSKSGFNSVEECFEDLTPHIWALETGLSSDPAMNWQLSALDGYTLVSNSDAHSLETIAREATLLNCPPTFAGLRQALKGPNNPAFVGTLEFFPDEGKYHLDGHRACNVRLSPQETIELKGICPVCHKPLTVGVLSRVEELADRPLGYTPPNAPLVESLTSLNQTLGQALGKGASSKAVKELKERLLSSVGNELYILRQWPLEDAKRLGGEVLSEALKRLRAGQVILNGGYDGVFGTVELFSASEREELKGQMCLLQGTANKASKASTAKTKEIPLAVTQNTPQGFALDEDQLAAVTHQNGHLQVVAGPGAGKTRVMVERVKHLLEQGVMPGEILVITFTRKAANELKQRLDGYPEVEVSTFHGLGFKLLNRPETILTEDERQALIKELVKSHAPEANPTRLAQRLSLLKQQIPGQNQADANLQNLFTLYQQRLQQLSALDMDDLVYQVVACQDMAYPAFKFIMVDEYQDVNPVQVEFLKRLSRPAGAQVMVIGDPRQAIYGFRGADLSLFNAFSQHFPGASQVELKRNYRSQAQVVNLAGQLMQTNLIATLPAGEIPQAATLASPQAEARWIAETVLELTGGLDSRQVEKQKGASGLYAPRDIAILYRLHQQAEVIAQALEELGIPVQRAGQEPLFELEGMDFTLQKVSLLSMHASKGLEFPVVFVTGLENGLIPYQPPQGQPASQDEETRLLFVALAGPKKSCLSAAAKSVCCLGTGSRKQTHPCG